MILLPGTAFAELVTWAGGQLGWAELGELTLEAPLVLPSGVACRCRSGSVGRAGRGGWLGPPRGAGVFPARGWGG